MGYDVYSIKCSIPRLETEWYSTMWVYDFSNIILVLYITNTIKTNGGISRTVPRFK